MKRGILFLLGITIFVPFCFALPFALPHAFFGTVTYSDGFPADGGNIYAKLNGEIVEQGTIFNGTYGYHENFILASITGGTIYFYLEGLNESIGNYEFEALGVTKLDLVINYPSPTTPTIPQGNASSFLRCSDFTQYCEVDWKCSGWSSCDSGFKTRQCQDMSNCEFKYNKPKEIMGCEEMEKSLIEENNNNKILLIMEIVTFILLLIVLAYILFK